MTAYYGCESRTHENSGVLGRHLAGEGQVASPSVRGHSTGAREQLVGSRSSPSVCRRRCFGSTRTARARTRGEDQVAAGGVTAVEAEHELVDVALRVRFVHRALVGGQKPPLGQRSDPVHVGCSSSASSPLARAARWAARLNVAEPGPPVIIHPGVGNHHRAVSEGVRECTCANGERCPRVG